MAARCAVFGTGRCWGAVGPSRASTLQGHSNLEELYDLMKGVMIRRLKKVRAGPAHAMRSAQAARCADRSALRSAQRARNAAR